MRPEDQLASLLAKVNADALRGFDFGPAHDLEPIARGVRNSTGGNDGDPPHPPDFLARLEGILRDFRSDREPDGFRTLRLLCHGICHHIDISADSYVLVGDPFARERLLHCVESYRRDPRRFRRLYDGLLRSFLGVDRQQAWFASSTVRAGNEELRAFLAREFELVRGIEPVPDWVSTLADYPEVISTDPGGRFAEDWLTGDGKAFHDASQRLALMGVSWLAAETLRSALAAACALDDKRFALNIPALLVAAGEPGFQCVRDDIYAGS
jgi:hypothetical protein